MNGLEDWAKEVHCQIIYICNIKEKQFISSWNKSAHQLFKANWNINRNTAKQKIKTKN